jgi:hypothetical protein
MIAAQASDEQTTFITNRIESNEVFGLLGAFQIDNNVADTM